MVEVVEMVPEVKVEVGMVRVVGVTVVVEVVV
jgi:hypothetical protein